jgi:hypothetical protein
VNGRRDWTLEWSRLARAGIRVRYSQAILRDDESFTAARAFHHDFSMGSILPRDNMALAFMNSL